MKIFSLLLAGLFLFSGENTQAFQLNPESSPEQRKLLGVSPYSQMEWLESRLASFGAEFLFSDSIHEELTTRILGCDGDNAICGGPEALTGEAAILVGVRWNDDPPFRLGAGQGRNTSCKPETIRFQTQPSCWLKLFKDAEKRAASGARFGPGDAMLYRSHFGDLQFLHAMAERDGVAAQDTQKAVMAWMEFTWRTAIREYPRDTRIRTLPLSGFDRLFGKSEWDLRDMFVLGSPLLERKIPEVAFGSLLHVLEDSFAEGHVERERPGLLDKCTLGNTTVKAPGRILEFHSYARQDHDAHARADSKAAKDRHLQNNPDVVDIGRPLVTAFDDRLPWAQVEPYLQCVFALSSRARAASPGDTFVASSR